MVGANASLPFRIIGIDHIGIVPKDLAAARQFLGGLLGLPLQGEEDVHAQGVHALMYASRSEQGRGDPGDGPRLELLEALNSDSPIAKYLAGKGGGIHHLALRVDDLGKALGYLQQAGVKLIDRQPRRGAHNSLVAFIHPHACGGILVELVEVQTA